MLGKKIGEGGNSEVFDWGTNQVIKLAKPNTNEAELQHELSNALLVWEKGLPVPKPYEVVYVDHRPGLIFEKGLESHRRTGCLNKCLREGNSL